MIYSDYVVAVIAFAELHDKEDLCYNILKSADRKSNCFYTKYIARRQL